MSEVIFYECDNCGAYLRNEPHGATKRVSQAGYWVAETRWLCCACYESVGGSCDGHE